MVQTRRVALPVDWLFAPHWLTVDQACLLSGWDTAWRTSKKPARWWRTGMTEAIGGSA